MYILIGYLHYYGLSLNSPQVAGRSLHVSPCSYAEFPSARSKSKYHNIIQFNSNVGKQSFSKGSINELKQKRQNLQNLQTTNSNTQISEMMIAEHKTSQLQPLPYFPSSYEETSHYLRRSQLSCVCQEQKNNLQKLTPSKKMLNITHKTLTFSPQKSEQESSLSSSQKYRNFNSMSMQSTSDHYFFSAFNEYPSPTHPKEISLSSKAKASCPLNISNFDQQQFFTPPPQSQSLQIIDKFTFSPSEVKQLKLQKCSQSNKQIHSSSNELSDLVGQKQHPLTHPQLSHLEKQQQKDAYISQEVTKVRNIWKQLETQNNFRLAALKQQKIGYLKKIVFHPHAENPPPKTVLFPQKLSQIQSILLCNEDELQKGICEEEENKQIYDWKERSCWEKILSESYISLEKDGIEKLSQEILEDFLNNVVSGSGQNNVKFMHESLKLIGWTPKVSERVCKSVSEIISNRCGQSQMNEFRQRYQNYEQKCMTWSLVDKIGGIAIVEEIITHCLSQLHRNTSLSSSLRFLGISNSTIRLAFWDILRQDELRYKQYFIYARNFFKLPSSRLSYTKFFLTIQLYLKTSLQRSHVQHSLINRIFLLIEQMRHFVTIPKEEDKQFIFSEPTQPKTDDQQSFPNFSSSSNPQVQSTSKTTQLSINPIQESDIMPQFCISIVIQIRQQLFSQIRYKHALQRLPLSQSGQNSYEVNLAQLVSMFCLNNNESISFVDVIELGKYRSLLLLTNDFFTLFTKIILDFLKNVNATQYFFKDTHMRLQHVRILLNRFKLNNQSLSSSKQENSLNYLQFSAFFNDVLGSNTLEGLLDKLVDLYYNKSELNKLCQFSKTHRARAHCRYILCFVYPVLDENKLPENVSAYDFQCYIIQKKLKIEFFNEFANVLEEIYIDQLHLQLPLVQRLIQQFQFQINGFEFIQRKAFIFEPSSIRNSIFRYPILQASQKNKYLINDLDEDMTEF